MNALETSLAENQIATVSADPKPEPQVYATREYAEDSEVYVRPIPIAGEMAYSTEQPLPAPQTVETALQYVRKNIRKMAPRVYECGDGSGD